MKSILFTFSLASCTLHAAEPAATQAPPAKVVDLRVEGVSAPTAVNSPLPRLGWRIETEERGWLQQSYQLLFATSAERLSKDEGDLWDSGPVASRKSQWLRYEGPPLSDGQVVHWKVRVTDRNGNTTTWSEPATMTVALNPPCPTNHSPLGDDTGARLSSFESSDPGLNALFEAASSQAPKITALTDLGLSLRGLSFHTPLLPRANGWLNLLNQSTNPLGYYPATLPADGSFGSVSSDAAILAAHAVWWATGDTSSYDRHLGAMKRYIFARKQFDQQYEDLPFGKLPPGLLPEGDPTPVTFIDDAMRALDVRLLLDMGRLASNDPYELHSVKQYSESLPDSFSDAHLFPDESLQYESITAQLLALRAGVLTTEEQKQAVSGQLLAALRNRGDRHVLQESPLIAQNLLPVLTWTGHADLALEILRTQPADQLDPAALVNCSEWLLSMLAGINSMEPGYTFLHLQPRIPDEATLSEAKASFQSPMGTVDSHWKYDDVGLLYTVTIPPNVLAQIELPTEAGMVISENGTPLGESPLFFNLKNNPTSTVFNTGSGTYQFRVGKAIP